MPEKKSREIKFKDETFYNEAVIAYREKDWGNGKHYTPNAGFRRDIVATVKTYDDLCIWIDLINSWGYWRDGKYHKRNPTDFKGLLTVFEMKQREAQRKKDEIQQAAIRNSREQRVSSRSLGRVFESDLFRLPKGQSGFKG
jgi:hypothetical protein